MQGFRFAVGGSLLSVAQDSAGKIGSKVYPGALQLCSLLPGASLASAPAVPVPAAADLGAAPRALLAALLAPGCTVLELGAGVCALPTLQLAHAGLGLRCVATDLPQLLPRLAANAAANCPTACSAREREDGRVGAEVLPLAWGVPEDVAALRDALRAGDRTRSRASGLPDVILGADVVYHDELIDPLLRTLRLLTDEEVAPGAGTPTVVIAYVQRFKRAKRFLRLARKLFDVQVLPLAPVVDYDVLTWALPLLAQRASDGADTPDEPPAILVTPQSADYVAYMRLLADAGAAAAAASAALSEASPAVDCPQPEGAGDVAKRASGHHIDSDSEDEYENSGLFASRLLASLADSATEASRDVQGDEAADELADNSEHTEGRNAPLLREARAGARALHLPFHAPLPAMVYVLRRRPH